MQLFRTKRLSDKIFGYTLLLYLAVVSAITAWLVFETYHGAKMDVYRELKLYERAFSKPLADNLWSMDMVKLASLVQGILQTEAIIGLQIIDPQNNRILARSGWVAGTETAPALYYTEDGTADRTPDTNPPADIFEYRFSLVYKFETTEENLGDVTFFS